MLARRIIPCLDCDLGVPGGRVVKGVEFKQIRYAGIPWELARRYYEDGADEIVFLDITASHERRETMTSVIKKTSESVFVPLAVGGGIRSVEEARDVFNAGADKITVNTFALKRPELISEISDRYGNQAVVVAIDAKRRYNLEPGREVVQTPEGPCWFECSFTEAGGLPGSMPSPGRSVRNPWAQARSFSPAWTETAPSLGLTYPSPLLWREWSGCL